MDVVIVVPCHNEQERLPAGTFRRFVRRHPEVGFLFVDDGSTDRTPSLLRRLCRCAPSSLRCIVLQRHVGKAEAVRTGLLQSLSLRGVRYVGFWDADLATPLDTISAFIAVHDAHPQLHLVMGARVPLLGRRVTRRPLHRLAGRLFATAAAATLSLAVYDTQCGAKLFRVTELTRCLFAAPFETRWIFDVEILARMVRHQCLTQGPRVEELVYELPLSDWRDVPGSKRRLSDYVTALRDLLVIGRRYMWCPRPVNRGHFTERQEVTACTPQGRRSAHVVAAP